MFVQYGWKDNDTRFIMGVTTLIGFVFFFVVAVFGVFVWHIFLLARVSVVGFWGSPITTTFNRAVPAKGASISIPHTVFHSAF